MVDGFVIGGHFGNHAAGGNGVLVAHKIADKVSITFLTADHELFLTFVFADFLGDVLETGQHIETFHVVVGGNLVDEVGGDDGFHHEEIVL